MTYIDFFDIFNICVICYVMDGIMDYKKVFGSKEDESIFLKTTTGPSVTPEDKVMLNRKGNAFFNSGDIESARRIFLTTGYSDGLIRVGDHYKAQGRLLDALRLYWTAPDRKKAESIITRLSIMIQIMLNEEKNNE